MESQIIIKIKNTSVANLYDEDNLPILPKKLEQDIHTKFKELVKDYVEEKGLEGDFLASDFGIDEAEELSFYGDFKIEVI